MWMYYIKVSYCRTGYLDWDSYKIYIVNSEVFWEGHKIWKNLPLVFDIYVRFIPFFVFWSKWSKTKKSAVLFVYFLYKKIQILHEKDSWFFRVFFQSDQKKEWTRQKAPLNWPYLSYSVTYFSKLEWWRHKLRSGGWMDELLKERKLVTIWIVQNHFWPIEEQCTSHFLRFFNLIISKN